MTCCLSVTSLYCVDDMLSALGSIVGRKHPSTVQAKQLKQSVPMMTVVLHLLTSQVTLPTVLQYVTNTVFYHIPLLMHGLVCVFT